MYVYIKNVKLQINILTYLSDIQTNKLLFDNAMTLFLYATTCSMRSILDGGLRLPIMV